MNNTFEKFIQLHLTRSYLFLEIQATMFYVNESFAIYQLDKDSKSKPKIVENDSLASTFFFLFSPLQRYILPSQLDAHTNPISISILFLIHWLCLLFRCIFAFEFKNKMHNLKSGMCRGITENYPIRLNPFLFAWLT